MKAKASLKTKYTLIFVAVMAFLMLLINISGRLFLEDYYTRRKISSLESAYEAIDKMVMLAEQKDQSIFDLVNDEYGTNVTDSPAVALFRSINDRMNINVVLIGNLDNSIISTSREGSWMAAKLRFYMAYKDAILENTLPEVARPQSGSGSGVTDYMSRWQGPSDDLTLIQNNGSYYIQRVNDMRSGTSYLEAWGSFSDNKTNFIMSLPLESIRESSAVTRRFMTWICFAVMVIGSIIIYAATSMLTKPVNRLAEISTRMSELDFTARYEGSTMDELGVLGSSMNSMSEKLEQTIDELKTANVQLQKDIEEKIRVDELRREFISNVSHELKTPLAIISGYAEGLKDGMAEDPDDRDYYCSVIMDETEKMTRMVKKLISLIHYENGQEAVDLQVFDLPEMLKSVIEVQRPVIEEKGIRIETELPVSAPVKADAFAIEEVFTNFLSNAVQHAAGEKRILIRLALQDPGVYRLSVYNDGEQIPEEALERIWDRFYKVDKARTRAYGGSGLGLSIVRAVMTAHGQPFGALNRENGVEFYACLEAAEAGSLDEK